MSLLVQGETFLPHQNRKIQMFYKRPPSAKYLAIVSTGLGRTNDVSRLEKWVAYISERQVYAVLLYNYPGVGDTDVRGEGVEQSEAMIGDLRFLVEVARGEGWVDGEMFLVGVSVGTGPTIQLLRESKERYRGVIMFSPYASPMNMVGIDSQLRHFFGCAKNEIRRLESSDALKEIAQQGIPQDITIVVGMSDITINPEFGAELYKIAKDTAHKARLVRLNRASHAALRTVAEEFVRPIFEDPQAVAAGEIQGEVRQTLYGRLLEGISWLHFRVRNLTAHF